SRFLLQLFFVCVWKFALWEAPSAALPWPRSWALADGAWAGHSRPGCWPWRCAWSSSSTGAWRITCFPRGERLAVQSAIHRRVSGVVWRDGLPAESLLGNVGRARSVAGRNRGISRRSDHILFPDEGSHV